MRPLCTLTYCILYRQRSFLWMFETCTS